MGSTSTLSTSLFSSTSPVQTSSTMPSTPPPRTSYSYQNSPAQQLNAPRGPRGVSRYHYAVSSTTIPNAAVATPGAPIPLGPSPMPHNLKPDPSVSHVSSHQDLSPTNIWIRSCEGSPPVGKDNQGILIPRQAVSTWEVVIHLTFSAPSFLLSITG